MTVFRSVTSVFSEGPTGARDGAPRVMPAFFSVRPVVGVALASAFAIALLLMVWGWLAAFLSSSVGDVGAIVADPSAGFSAWIAAPIFVAFAGWAFAYARRERPRPREATALQKRLYVFFLNKGYFDEVYDAFIARPTVSFSHWAWRRIDQGIVDRLVVSLGTVCVAVASRLGYLDRAVDGRVVSVGTGSVRVARWLGKFVDTAALEKTVEGLGRGVDASGHAARRYEPRTLQHNLLVIVFWLVAALGFYYWIAR